VDKVIERLKNEFVTEEARYAYADSVTNAFVTGQIKELREARNLTQDELADLVGTKQSGISRWLNSGFSSCKVETLRKFAKALGVRLKISFEEFGSLPTDVRGFTKERLAPRKFEDDPAFKDQPEDSEIAEIFRIHMVGDQGYQNPFESGPPDQAIGMRRAPEPFIESGAARSGVRSRKNKASNQRGSHGNTPKRHKSAASRTRDIPDIPDYPAILAGAVCTR
jgi:transcriptional regulator with XRE-family HTH domain